jgi:hypothetical protein
MPVWRFLEEDVADWREAERTWIGLWRVVNPALCNVADGGNQWPLSSTLLALQITNDAAHRADPAYLENKRKAGAVGGIRGGHRVWELHPNLATDPKRLQGCRRGGHRLSELHPEVAHRAGKLGGPIANHNRWHVKRDRINSVCFLCRQSLSDVREEICG